VWLAPRVKRPRAPGHGAPALTLPAVEPMALDVLVARRFTLTDLQEAPARARLQLLHGLRAHHAASHSIETMEGPDALGLLYDFVDLGPGTDPSNLDPYQLTHKRSGLVFLRVGHRGNPGRCFEGWFWDRRRHPSTWASPRDGRLFLAGTLAWTGVSLERGRPRVEPSTSTVEARSLALGFALLGPDWRVAVTGRTT